MPLLAGRRSQRWAVVGGGMLGLTIAKGLAAAGHRVSVLESASHFGGLASAWRLGDTTWDRFYHVTLQSDLHTRKLLEEIGLSAELRWEVTRTGFYSHKGLHSLSNSVEYLKFPLIGLLSKLRLGLTILYASRISDWKRLERVPVGDWLRKLSGRETYELIWLPLLRSKLGEKYRDTSAAFIWTTIARMYAARRSGMKREMFGYVNGGYARILERFADSLKTLGVTLRTECPVGLVERMADGRIRIATPSGDELFDQCVVTAAPPLLPRLLPQLAAEEKQKLQAIPYLGVVCASVLLHRPLAGFYVTNIVDPSIPFTGVIEMSALVDKKEFRGKTLVYLPKYLDPADPMFNESDEAIEERFLNGLRRMYPDFAKVDVAAVRIARARFVAAVPTLNYSELVPPFATSVPGVYTVNSSQIVNGTLNVNETVQLALRALPELLGHAEGNPVEQEGVLVG